jgi:hypothetical protein
MNRLIDRLTEAEFQGMIVERARVRGWLVYHVYDSRRSSAGFPDLVMVRAGKLVLAEVKTAKGRLSPAQAAWFAALSAVEDQPRVTVAVWRPEDWSAVCDLIDGGPV